MSLSFPVLIVPFMEPTDIYFSLVAFCGKNRLYIACIQSKRRIAFMVTSPVVNGPNLFPVRSETPLLQVQNVSKHFPIKRGLLSKTVGYVKAVTDISFELR